MASSFSGSSPAIGRLFIERPPKGGIWRGCPTARRTGQLRAGQPFIARGRRPNRRRLSAQGWSTAPEAAILIMRSAAVCKAPAAARRYTKPLWCCACALRLVGTTQSALPVINENCCTRGLALSKTCRSFCPLKIRPVDECFIVRLPRTVIAHCAPEPRTAAFQPPKEWTSGNRPSGS